ncbi:MAG TPA: SCO family protein [Bryobacteraceae bacterium]
MRTTHFLFAASLLLTQAASSSPVAPGGLDMSGSARPDILKGVDIEQRLNSQLPLDAVFRDENGETVQLAQYFSKRPVVLALVYYECPMLCTQILNGVVQTAKSMTLAPGKDYDVVVISFDPKETPAMAMAKKTNYMKKFGRPETAAGWHFLTGATPSIDRVTNAVGFRYKWDPALSAYAHASAVYVLTPEGKLSKYFYGISYSATDMRFGLIEASHDKIGTAVDELLLFCCQFDPHSGKYTLAIVGVLRLAGAATLLMLSGYVAKMLRRDKAKKTGAALS